MEYNDYYYIECLPQPNLSVYDGGLMQPIGFVWTYKPRYRVKAVSRKQE